MNFIGYRTLKTGIGSVIAMIIAKELGLQYAVSAGVITILSIQNTKRQSVKIAIERMLACVMALTIAAVIFNTLGYTEISFGVFLLLFIPLSVKFKLKEGIVVNSVLVTHLLLEKTTSIPLLINELSLMIVGAGVALLLNLYMPSIENEIKDDQLYIEKSLSEIFIHMAEALRNNYVSIEEETLFKNLESRLNIARDRAYKYLNNYFIHDSSYYVEYMEMRHHQFETAKRMREHFKRFFMTFEHSMIIADFTEKVAKCIYESNDVTPLLNDIETLRNDFRNMDLPKTREEFENRAMLFQFLNDMEQFLEIKKDFILNLKDKS
ncbi:aromatic acid exporter family protein [Clostridium hydrogeniformans]|uniref:aromatic acid exporter family protein n=1 Tax=Clostridium hydrogeniformans TaxID=349933 RepID=UPI000484B521|nr:aromatic acid exporter family protein [Clostridium hydrogeniformans]